MIQRIQSIYLFLVALTTSLIYVFPFAEYVKDDQRYNMNIFGLINLSTSEKIFSIIPVLIIVNITIIVAIASLFMFKNRILQLKLGRLNIFLFLILLGVIFYYSDNAVEALGKDNVVIFYQLGAMLPIASILFTFLANKAIRKDEELVRSADRIR
jgi:hypothetical protein